MGVVKVQGSFVSWNDLFFGLRAMVSLREFMDFKLFGRPFWRAKKQLGPFFWPIHSGSELLICRPPIPQRRRESPCKLQSHGDAHFVRRIGDRRQQLSWAFPAVLKDIWLSFRIGPPFRKGFFEGELQLHPSNRPFSY